MVSVKCDSNMAKSFILNGNHEKFIIMAVSQQGTLCTVIALKVTQCYEKIKRIAIIFTNS